MSNRTSILVGLWTLLVSVQWFITRLSGVSHSQLTIILLVEIGALVLFASAAQEEEDIEGVWYACLNCENQAFVVYDEDQNGLSIPPAILVECANCQKGMVPVLFKD